MEQNTAPAELVAVGSGRLAPTMQGRLGQALDLSMCPPQCNIRAVSSQRKKEQSLPMVFVTSVHLDDSLEPCTGCLLVGRRDREGLGEEWF